MRITIAAVGRMRKGPEQDLYAQYLKRITWAIELREVEAKRRMPRDALISHEAELLRKASPPGATVIALDRGGKMLDSEALARRIENWQDSGIGKLAFLIGGADGLAPELLGTVDLVLSFGPVTWPHLLMRGLLAEQLYRAQQILTGHPYHR